MEQQLPKSRGFLSGCVAGSFIYMLGECEYIYSVLDINPGREHKLAIMRLSIDAINDSTLGWQEIDMEKRPLPLLRRQILCPINKNQIAFLGGISYWDSKSWNNIYIFNCATQKITTVSRRAALHSG